MDDFISERVQRRINSNPIQNQSNLFINVIHNHPKEFVENSSVGELPLDDKDHSDFNSFHRAISSVLMIAQIFALMPVEGIRATNATSLRFRWFNLRMFYTLWSQVCYVLLILAFLFIQKDDKEKIMMKKYMIIVFFGCAMSNSVLSVVLAKQWPSLMMRLHRLELSMKQNYGYPERLATRFRIISVLILSISLCEHFLSNFKKIQMSFNCADSAVEWINIYYQSIPVCSLINGYSHIVCAIFQQMSLIAAFSWNFMDIFITLISVMLTARLRQITQRLFTIKNRQMPARFWRQIREDYTQVVHSVRLFDEHLNKIVFLSVGNGLYFICLQLLHSISTNDEQTSLYFYVSFGHLLLRTSTMGYFAAGIHEESKQPATVLFSVPSASFTTEVERFLLQVTSDNVSLTGSHLFSITKATLLTLAGTIVTYEIVLIQLAPDDSYNSTVSANITGLNYLCPEKMNR